MEAHDPTRRSNLIGHNNGPSLASGTRLLSIGEALIYKPSRSAMTSGRRNSKDWVLRFEHSSRAYVEPLMGWTARDGPMGQIELAFNSLGSAIRYAERNAVPYRVYGQAAHKDYAVTLKPATRRVVR